MPPRGTVGFGFVKSSETPLLVCSVGGVPGPTEIYWQRGDELNAARYVLVIVKCLESEYWLILKLAKYTHMHTHSHTPHTYIPIIDICSNYLVLR